MTTYTYVIKKLKHHKRKALRCWVTDTEGNTGTNIIYADCGQYGDEKQTVIAVKIYAIYDLFRRIEKPITREMAQQIVREAS